MQRSRFLALALVLSVALVASFEATAVASGSTDAAKKKCKKGYKLKKGKCTKQKSKKSTTPKVGIYIGQAAGNGEIRLRLEPKVPGGSQSITVIRGEARATCSDGGYISTGLSAITAILRGNAFYPNTASRPLSGSFNTATTLSGTVQSQFTTLDGDYCDTGVVSFSAKWAGK